MLSRALETAPKRCADIAELSFLCSTSFSEVVRDLGWLQRESQAVLRALPVPTWEYSERWGFEPVDSLEGLLLKLAGGDRNAALTAAEIGVFHGVSSSQLLRRFPSLRMLLVDKYHFFGDDNGMNFSGIPAFELACEALPRTFGPRATMVLQRSVDVVPWLPVESIDLVYIDGDHTYQGVLADMEAWWRVVRPGANTGCQRP